MVVVGGDGNGGGCGGGDGALCNGLLVSCGLPPQIERRQER